MRVIQKKNNKTFILFIIGYWFIFKSIYVKGLGETFMFTGNNELEFMFTASIYCMGPSHFLTIGNDLCPIINDMLTL